MGGATGFPAINEIAFFLNAFAPDVAAELAQKGPEYARLLQPGVIGGKEEEPSEVAKTNGLRVRCEILKKALEQATLKADEHSVVIQHKLGSLRLLRFVASVFSSLGAMGAAGSALMDEQLVTVLLSLVSLTANIANAASDTFILGTSKKEGDLLDALRKLALGRSLASLTASHLIAAVDNEFSVSEIARVLKDANVQYRDLTKALTESIF